MPSDENSPGPFYQNIKKHKPPLYPGRLNSTTCNSPMENVSAFTAYELKSFVESLPHCLRDTNDFLFCLDNLNNNHNFEIEHNKSMHVTCNVIDMFSSIPQSPVIEKCKEFLDQHQSPPVSTECILEAIDITLKNNIGQFNG